MDRTVIINEEVNIACDVAGKSRNASDKAPFAQKTQKTMRHLPTQARNCVDGGHARTNLDARNPVFARLSAKPGGWATRDFCAQSLFWWDGK